LSNYVVVAVSDLINASWQREGGDGGVSGYVWDAAAGVVDAQEVEFL
jgi:hypothetical protein